MSLKKQISAETPFNAAVKVALAGDRNPRLLVDFTENKAFSQKLVLLALNYSDGRSLASRMMIEEEALDKLSEGSGVVKAFGVQKILEMLASKQHFEDLQDSQNLG